MELLLGCGHSRDKKVSMNGREAWDDLVTLDQYPECEPDIVLDLNVLPYWRLSDNEYDEIHAYCVLEHCGKQGDWRFFFDQWSEFYRIVKPGGTFHGITPLYTSQWAWGDPSHARIIGLEALTFLDRTQYGQIKAKGSSMSDFRWYYHADWRLIASQVGDGQLGFVLRAIK